MLRVQQEECEREKIAALQTQLEEAHKTRSELDTENRLTELISLCESAPHRCVEVYFLHGHRLLCC